MRTDLQRALIESVARVPDISLVTGTNVAGFAANEAGVTVAAKQGLMTLSFEGTCLIGADGVQSFVRKRLVEPSKDALRFSGNEAWRTLVSADQVAPELLLPETNLWLGPDAHVVHYPLRGGRVVNVAVIIGKASAPQAQADSWSNAGDPQLIAARFSKWHPLVRGLIASAPEWLTWPLFEHEPLAGWTAGRIALWAMPRIPCCRFWRKAPRKRSKMQPPWARRLQRICHRTSAFGLCRGTARPHGKGAKSLAPARRDLPPRRPGGPGTRFRHARARAKAHAGTQRLDLSGFGPHCQPARLSLVFEARANESGAASGWMSELKRV